MPRKKKNEAPKDWTEAHYIQAMDRVLESVRQLRQKEGPIYERWKEGMKAFAKSLEKKGD